MRENTSMVKSMVLGNSHGAMEAHTKVISKKEP